MGLLRGGESKDGPGADWTRQRSSFGAPLSDERSGRWRGCVGDYLRARHCMHGKRPKACHGHKCIPARAAARRCEPGPAP